MRFDFLRHWYTKTVFATSAAATLTLALCALSTPSRAADLFDRFKRPLSKSDLDENDGKGKSSKSLAAQEKAAKSTVLADIAKGRSHERTGDWDKARRVYEEILQKLPNEAEAHHRLGVVADQQRRFAEAQGHFTDALRLNPRDPEMHNSLGYCFFLQGKLEKAESSLAKAIQIDPKSPRYHVNLGMVLGFKGKSQEAFVEFSKAGSEADAYYNMAYVFASLEKPDQAKECFKRALGIDPKHELSRKALQAFELYESGSKDERDVEFASNGVRLVPYQESTASTANSGTGSALGNGSNTNPKTMTDTNVRGASHAEAASAPPMRNTAVGAGQTMQSQSRGMLNRNMSSNR